MKDNFMNDLNTLCFDVLGDHIELDDYRIEEKDNKVKVIVKEKALYSPKEFLIEDWENALFSIYTISQEFSDWLDDNVELCFE